MRYAISLALLLMSGCAQMKVFVVDYREPLSGETAMARFSTNGDVMLIPDRNCEDWSAPGAGVVVANSPFGGPKYNGRKIGVTGEVPTGFTSGEVKLAAGKPLTVFFKSVITDASVIYTCEGSFVFLPKAGEEYQVTVSHDKSAGVCRWEPKSLLNPAMRVSIYKTTACK